MKNFIVTTFALSLLIISIPPYRGVYVRAEPQPLIVVALEVERYVGAPTPIVATPEVEAYIDEIFGDDAEIMTAVLKHESGLRINAKNWNCHYYDVDGKRVSKSCKVADRPQAWSVDCGIGQTNIKGQECPAEWMTLAGNMAEVKRRYDAQGLRAWSSYTNGGYKKFMVKLSSEVAMPK